MSVLFCNLYFTGRKLFTSTTYKHYKVVNNNVNETQTEIEETFSNNNTQSKTIKVIKYTYESVKILITFIISYCISISSIFTEIHKSVMGKTYN